MRARCVAVTLLCCWLALAEDSPKPSAKKNVLGFANGATVVAFSDQYDAHAYGAMNILDGSDAFWSSANDLSPPHTIVIELPQSHLLDTIAVDTRGVQEAGYPGISVKHVELWVSAESATAGFRKVGARELPKQARTEVPLVKDPVARWVKLIVTSNHGNAYSEIEELEVYGTPVGPAPALPDVTGSYSTNYGDLYLTNTGGRVTGCYPGSSGTIVGATDGRLLTLQWRQGDRVGSTTMVLSSGGTLNGYWYEKANRGGAWYGKKTSNVAQPCPNKEDVASLLQQTGRAILYGVHFDPDSTELRADSEAALQQVLALLKATPAMKVRIEGHTDSTNTDAYNRELSKRRALAVLAWLVANGVSSGRLKAEGFGKANPVADNSTAQGRALNRRVEIAIVK